jgi:hypothetical protein
MDQGLAYSPWMVCQPSFASSYSEPHHRRFEGMIHADEIEEKSEHRD